MVAKICRCQLSLPRKFQVRHEYALVFVFLIISKLKTHEVFHLRANSVSLLKFPQHQISEIASVFG